MPLTVQLNCQTPQLASSQISNQQVNVNNNLA